jgi:hypothetical protein
MMRGTAAPYALHRDGTQVVASTRANQPDARARSFVVTNFFDELASAARPR